MSFKSDIKKFTIKAEKNSEKVLRGTVLAMFSNVVFRTPVDTGRLRGDWQANIAKPADGNTNIIDQQGAATITAITGEVVKMRLGQKIYLINTLPYAKPIEEGSSTQAPKGMVKVTIAEFQREISKQAKKVR